MPNYEELELEMIDYGLDEIKVEEGELIVYCNFTDYGTMQKFFEERNIEVEEASLERIPTVTKRLSDEEAEAVIKLVDRFEEDDDVTNVFYTMDMSE